MQQENFFIRHTRIITIISLAGITFCIVLIIIFALRKEFDKQNYLSLQFAPAKAILTLDNGTELHNGTYEFQPGSYTGTLSAKDFQPKTISFEVAPRQTTSITNYLMPTSNDLSYYEKSATDISTLRLIKDDPEVSSFLESYDYKLSIYDKLPFYITWLKRPDDYPTYTLKITDSRNNPECQGTLCLLATGPVFNQDEISKYLSQAGFDIKDYEVFYEHSY